MDIAKAVFLASIIFVYMETQAVSSSGEGTVGVADQSRRADVVHWSGYGEERLSTVVVEGRLLCHGAVDHHKLSRYTSPVSDALIAVVCGTSGRRHKMKKSWAKGSTGNYGEFLIDLPSHLHAIPNLEKVCFVKVLHLPRNCPCRQAFTGKHKSIKLTVMGEGIRAYTTHNIHLVQKPSKKQMIQAGKSDI